MSNFGEITGYPEGSAFTSREEARQAGLHRHKIAGISGTGTDGADAIVLNDGYEDDEDYGDTIIYTGEGGQDPRSKRQIKDQQYEKGNAGLRESCIGGHPVRILRGPKLRSPYAPVRGYRYDGLYFIERFWTEKGKSGFNIIRFFLRKIPSESSKYSYQIPISNATGEERPGRTASFVTRVIRDTTLSKKIKALYDYHCQVCGVRLEVAGGAYAEAAHIRPLGRPHNGPDVTGNILCLCPNHHALFDLGGFTINDDWTLNLIQGKLTVDPSHQLRIDCVNYHRKLFQTN